MADRSPLTADGRSTSDKERKSEQSCWDAFTQQKLCALHPWLKPHHFIGIYTLGGILFVSLGVVLLFIAWSVEENVAYYTNIKVNDIGVGVVELDIKRDLEPPIWVYYQLEQFHQNHRRYVKSRDDDQLSAKDRAAPRIRESELSNCKPWVASTDGRVNHPCGLVARSVFNDTFVIMAKQPGDGNFKRLSIDRSAKAIAWPADVERGKFVNLDPEAKTHHGLPNQVNLDMWLLERFPPVRCEQRVVSESKPFVPVMPAQREETHTVDGTPRTFKVPACSGYTATPKCEFVDAHGQSVKCTGDAYEEVPSEWGVENGQFIVWMRVAGLPKFKKLWGRIDTPLKANTKLQIHVHSVFPVKPFGGEKAIVVSTSSVMGGRNDFLGIGYLTVGVCCFLFAAWFVKEHLSRGPSSE